MTSTVGGLDFATPDFQQAKKPDARSRFLPNVAVTAPAAPVQEKLPWSAPAVEEIFLTPEEVAALWKLPSVVEGGEPLSRELHRVRHHRHRYLRRSRPT